MAQEAFVGRLRAIYDKDKEALLQWVGSQAEYDESLELFDLVGFDQAPSGDNVALSVSEVLLDRDNCVVTQMTTDVRGVVKEAVEASNTVAVWWPSGEESLALAAFWSDGSPSEAWQKDCDLTARVVVP